MTEQNQEEISDEEALKKIAEAMQGNAPSLEDKQSIHTFLFNVATSDDTTKTANLRDDKDMNELGSPCYNVRGAKEMSLISNKIMENGYFKDYFEAECENTLATSLSRDGFLVKQATTSTKQIADVTKRKKVNSGWFGKKSVETSGESGGTN